MSGSRRDPDRGGALAPEGAGLPGLVLVVADDPSDLRTIDEGLRPLGLSMRECNDAFETIASLYESECSLALIDLRMPGLDGLGLAAEIRRHPRAGGLPVLFVAGPGQDGEELHRAYGMRCVDVVARPLVPHVLRGKVSLFVELARRRWTERCRRRLEELLLAIARCTAEPMQEVERGLGSVDGASPLTRRLRRQASRASRLVGRIEEVARLCADPAPAEDLDLAAPIAHALERMAPWLEDAGGGIDIDVAPRVRAHPAHLRALFCELFDNAVRFRGLEPLRIRVRASRGPGEVLVCVEDNGVGIPDHEIEQVFALFPPAGDGTSRSGGARDVERGIGLALAKRLLQINRGEIWCEANRNGPGTRVSFTLPGALDACGPRAESQGR